ncbi:hypothetical protein DL766_007134 [Monosporascus sp. MC13-8B]|nr:hypothetical protein DL766_007134 [Monosporascus sp. MC13-8B]
MLQVCASILHICYNTRAILKTKPWGLSRIQDEIRDLRGVLETLFHLAIDDDKANHSQASSIRMLAQSQQGGPLTLCLDDLRNLEKILLAKYTSEPRTKIHAVIRAVSWDLSEREFMPYLDRLSRSKATLNLAISANQAALVVELQRMTCSMNNDISTISNSLEKLAAEMSVNNFNQTQKEILKWLSPVDYRSSYASAVSRCYAGTGQWLLETPAFRSWRDGEGPNLLWLSGFAGSGKTILVSNAVRNLTVWAGEEKSRPQVACFFCDFRSAKSQDVAVIMGNIVSQLIVQSGSIPALVEEAFQTSTVAGTYRSPEIPFLVDVLELLTCQSRALVLIDGVDEVDERRDLLSFLQQSCRPQSNVRILVSSREEQDLRESLVDVHNIRIEERISQVNDDISRYLNGRLQFDPSLQWLKPHIKDDIRVSVEQHACGILRTVKSIRRSLKELPSGLEETYDRILSRVPKADHDTVRRILLWVSFATVPLTVEELHSAIAVEWDVDHLDEESLLRSPLDIFSLTGGLVGLSDQGHVINADNPFSWDFYPRHATNLYYAATFGLADTVKALIESNAPLDLPGSRYGGTALHGAVYRLRVPIVELLLKAGADINRPDFLGVSPLHTAATLGSLDLIKLMLRYSADATALDGMGETPIDWAEKSGQLNIRKCLQGSAAIDETAAEDPQSDTFWRASKKTIPYFPDFHCRRSGVECSLILKVQIGARIITKEELPGPSFCS